MDQPCKSDTRVSKKYYIYFTIKNLKTKKYFRQTNTPYMKTTS